MRTFSQLVCNSPSVRHSLASYRPIDKWWIIVLWLHGKPISLTLSPQESRRCIADGFKFYARLYRGLALVFLLLAVTLPILNGMTGSNALDYWCATCFLVGGYLWCVAGLGHAGARTYLAGDGHGALVAFVVMITIFLSFFVAGASVALHCGGILADALNLAAATVLLLFGVGSYLIEILYLATEPHN